VTGLPLEQAQRELVRYLRDPRSARAPAGVEQRRLKIYRELIYNNIESFISGGFPVLRRLYSDGEWRDLVCAFICGHRCETPYFLEISREFVDFVAREHSPRECDPPFLAELAHYEWVELALDISTEQLPALAVADDPLAVVPQLSPLARLLAYRFPVHRIGPGFRPRQPGEPTCLAVYRDREDAVRFMALNAASARLLALVRDNSVATSRELLLRLGGELGMDGEAILAFGARQLVQWLELSVIVPRLERGAAD
jgi:hypothetical protein